MKMKNFALSAFLNRVKFFEGYIYTSRGRIPHKTLINVVIKNFE